MSSRRITLALGALLALAAPLPAGPAGANGSAAPVVSAADRDAMLASGFADTRLLGALDRDGEVRVLISFATPGSGGRMEGAHRRDHRARSRIDAGGREILARFAPGEFRLGHRFRSLGALAGTVDAAGLGRLFRNPDVLRVGLDRGGSGQLLEAAPLAELTPLAGLGLSGAGVTVAVLDSGLDTDHPDLADDLVNERCWCGGGCCPGGDDTQLGAGSAEDSHGHGTNVAGIITSGGGVAPAGGAPDASIVAIKVLDENNEFCCVSDVLAGLQYVLDDRPDVDVVNMSLGTFDLYEGECDTADIFTVALATLADLLVQDGRVLVASSMNDASGTEMGAPACLSDVIAVGAVYDSDQGTQLHPACGDLTTAADQVTCWSNSNDTTDLVAPGASTTSTGLGGGTSSFRGTSQASPLAAACAALLLEADPALSPAEVRAALTSSATWVTDAKNSLDFPRLDCREALASLVSGLADCDDQVDNDGDGLADHPDDPGCASVLDPSESSAALRCDDGADNDGDGAVDMADPGCKSPQSFREDPQCDDGVDNDGDGGIDWDGAPPDPQCVNRPWLNRERSSGGKSCGAGAELALLLAALLAFRTSPCARPAPPR
ncbi:MAG: S8 family serine peptidase [Proteobacteria bacterium]|nr:S8 family serine peptidase [Pseudomonadota bacterium]